ncbi:putative metalloprotease CJM1_0395 family protein [Pontibacter sp. JAM-7]|uniref:putative metalloprotease CJM1_0395 family protein n=1 Tax=Pontibacter sp. JAM-7 TaxID=3366581 RepID=UPI003AF931D0
MQISATATAFTDPSLKTSGNGAVTPASVAPARPSSPSVILSLSPEARARSANEQQSAGSADGTVSSQTTAVSYKTDAAQQSLVRELARRDLEVRTHERIHASVGGRYTSAPSFTYERGPDGRLYAVSGEVQIDTTSIPGNPQASLEKAQVIQRAALAVPDPSPADRNAAAQARAMAAAAQAEIARLDRSGAEGESDQVQPEVIAATTATSTADSEAKVAEEKDETDTPLFELDSERMARVSQQLAELNRKLFNAGAMEQFGSTGSLVDLSV